MASALRLQNDRLREYQDFAVAVGIPDNQMTINYHFVFQDEVR